MKKSGRISEHPNGFIASVRLPSESGSTFMICLRPTKAEAETVRDETLAVVKKMRKNLTTPDS